LSRADPTAFSRAARPSSRGWRATSFGARRGRQAEGNASAAAGRSPPRTALAAATPCTAGPANIRRAWRNLIEGAQVIFVPATDCIPGRRATWPVEKQLKGRDLLRHLERGPRRRAIARSAGPAPQRLRRGPGEVCPPPNCRSFDPIRDGGPIPPMFHQPGGGREPLRRGLLHSESGSEAGPLRAAQAESSKRSERVRGNNPGPRPPRQLSGSPRQPSSSRLEQLPASPRPGKNPASQFLTFQRARSHFPYGVFGGGWETTAFFPLFVETFGAVLGVSGSTRNSQERPFIHGECAL